MKLIEEHYIQLPARMHRDERVHRARIAVYAHDDSHRGGWYVELLDLYDRVVWDEELDECGQVARQARDILAELDPEEVL